MTGRASSVGSCGKDMDGGPNHFQYNRMESNEYKQVKEFA